MDGSSKGWWQASDGRWYPPGMANHPAARRLARPAEPDRTSTTVAATPADPANPAAPADTPGTRRGSWRLWAVLATQMALAVALVVIVVGAPNPRSVETRHRPQTVDATDATTTVPEPTEGSTAPSTSPTTSQPIDPSIGPAWPLGRLPADLPTTPTSGTATEPGGPGQPADQSPSEPTTAVSAAPTTAPAGPHTPTTAADCKDGGWARLVDDQGRPFPNQGKCLAYVHQDG